MPQHCQWRDSKEFSRLGLKFSTTSEEAVKLYDATLTQYVGWYDEPSVGGIETSCRKLMETDPNWVMSHVLNNGLELMGTGRSTRLDPEFNAGIDKMIQLANNPKVSSSENEHVKGVKLLADGLPAHKLMLNEGFCAQNFKSRHCVHIEEAERTAVKEHKQKYVGIVSVLQHLRRHMDLACDVWDKILMENPLDMLAIKFAHDAHFYLGYQPRMRDTIARVYPYWSTSMPLYSYLLGMHSFGLCETNFFTEAENMAQKGLELNPQDAWSTHAMAHVLEMTGRAKDGIAFLSTTMNYWTTCGMLACHNFWHWAVYHIEKAEYQGAVDIYDGEVGRRVRSSGAMLDIVDACSLLYRLEMENVNVSDRWQDLYEICRLHANDHILAFNDAHVLLSLLGAKQKETTQKMVESMKDFISTGKGVNQRIMREVGYDLCSALVAHDDGDYSQAVDLLYPLRYKVMTIGGSNAQRDLFNQFLIHAAMKSSKSEHTKLARQLLFERKALKENSPLTDRLMGKAMAAHTGQ